ncbi:otubain [Medicago truncatula]|uniref:Otubain n=1 Tax=Medicago truncatula TaxID=3880 RepID=A0A072UB11_MEDTR|nr:otubain [Medicago truncatula]
MKLVLGCKRGGEYKGTKKKLKQEDKCSRKCESFHLGCMMHASKLLIIDVVSGLHNHKSKQKLVGHILVGCLNAKEPKLVVDMTRNLVKPKNNLSTVKI